MKTKKAEPCWGLLFHEGMRIAGALDREARQPSIYAGDSLAF